MKAQSAVLCLLPSVLLIVSSLGSVRSANELINCPGKYNCSCNREITGEYQLLCPQSRFFNSSVLSALIIPERYLHIECTYITQVADYDLLRGLQVGNINSVSFRLCPLPHNMSLSELIRAIGVNSTSSLLFQSFRNLSHALDRKHLVGLDSLTRLLLSSNGLGEVPSDLVQDLVNLNWLDLRGNNLHIPHNFFDSQAKLELLELSNNGIKNLEPGVFRNLRKLRVLNLWQNNLSTVSRDVLANLTNLEQLDLSHNSMVSLPVDAFQDLRKLFKLYIFHNNFKELPEGLLSPMTSLSVIRLNENREVLKLPARFLANFSNLTEVYLSRNRMTSVPEDLFRNSSAIRNISLQGNALEEIPTKLFHDQAALRALELNYNRLQTLPDYAFKNQRLLESLWLGYNRIQNISRNAFFGLVSLQVLDMEHNSLDYIDLLAFSNLRQLRHARFSHNQLHFVDPVVHSNLGYFTDKQSPFNVCTNLETLYLANNTIAEVFQDWRVLLSKLRVLDLSHNHIESLMGVDIHFASDEVSVDLRNNNISLVDLSDVEEIALIQPPSRFSKRNVRLLLEGNPLHCDCRTYELSRYFEGKIEPRVYELVNLIAGNLTCSSPAEYSGVRFTNLQPRALTCPLLTEKLCPQGCTCSIRRHDFALVVDCSHRGLTQVPTSLPQVGYTNHTEVNLEGNNIQQLPNSTSVDYLNVTHLFLSHNNLTDIPSEFIPPQIKVLTIDNNNVGKLSTGLVRKLTNSTILELLMLHNNPWQCDCSARDLVGLVQTKFNEISWINNVTCNANKRSLLHVSISELCPVSLVLIISCVFIATCGIVIGSLAALYYRYHREVKVWLYSHHMFLWFVTEQELDKDKLFDAFVSYSHKDEDFVINTLVPGLEPDFKLCLHYRDWIAGEWIPNQIARSVEDSRRTLVVLSPNFLESVWGRMEFRAAHKQALTEGRARVIVLVYGDIGPTEQLDPELKAYISMNTYVKWGDPWFWKKLKYALPHPPDLVKGGLLKRRGSRKEHSFIDDKLELIHTLESLATPPGATTPPAEAAVTSMETVTTMPNGRSNGHAKQLA